MEASKIVGILLATVSFSLVVLSRIQLGKSFSISPKASDLVTTGLYSRIRHPMYLFVDLTICGLALALKRWPVLLILVVLLPLQIRNARREDKLLAKKFATEYETYRRRTWL